MFVKILIYSFFAISACSCLDLKNLTENVETIADLYEGDILLVTGRNGIIRESMKWPKDNRGLVMIPYTFQPNAYSK